MVLAGLFEEMGEDGEAQISRLSAASCFMKAHQFSRAEELLRELEGAPEAAQMLKECRGQRDDPLCQAPPDVHALVQLLTKKGIISEDEWVDALTAATAS